MADSTNCISGKVPSASKGVDARGKIAMLAFFSVCIFFADTWAGLAVFALVAIIMAAVFRPPISKVVRLGTVIYVIAALTILFNALKFEYGHFAFSEEGLVRGCFFAARIILLVAGSLIVCLSTDPMAISTAFRTYLRPLGRSGLPVDDISTILSIAIRFIPLTAKEYFAIRDAQWSRGARFDEGSVIQIVKSHCAIMIPMFVNLFRKADLLAMSMDSRGYGITGISRVDINYRRMDAFSALITISICLLCVLFAVFL